jgi:hypothetical protein
MTAIFRSLEDRIYPKNKVVINELQSCEEVLFVHEGTYDIGFEVNRQKYYKLNFGKSTVIGGHQICFRQRYLFIYKSSSNLKCYSIRLKVWNEIMQKYPGFYMSIRSKFVQHFVTNIFRPMMKQKKMVIDLFDLRKDFT